MIFTDKLKSNAKLNLQLSIIGKNNDNYHMLNMVTIPINLFDTINIKINRDKEKSINIVDLNSTGMPTDKKNIVYKAIEKFMSIENIEFDINLLIYKEIPMESGTGGASSNVATVVKYLYDIFNINKEVDYLIRQYKEFGEDIAFFFVNKPSFIENTGDLLSSIQIKMKKYYFVLIHPEIKQSTIEAYKKVTYFSKPIDINFVTNSINNGDFSVLSNDFLDLINNDTYDKIIKDLNKYGSKYTSITGSGSTVFGIFPKEKSAKDISNKLSKKYRNIYICNILGDNNE